MLLTWLNDVDGRAIMNSIRNKIKMAVLSNQTELDLFAHQGRFINLNDYSDLESSDIDKLTKLFNSLLENHPDEIRALLLKNFQYGDDEDLDCVIESLSEYYEFDPSALYIEGRQFPLTHNAFEFLFTSLGFNVKILINNPTQWIHKIKISW